MNESVGNTALFNIIIIFVIIMIAFFIGSLAYSKAFKVKNKIIEEIEKNETFDNEVEDEVNTWLSKIGYRVNFRGTDNREKCKSASDKGKLVNTTSAYQYCVYEINTCNESNKSRKCGKYYRVTAYMYFDVPIISQMIQIPINGETMIFNEIEG